VICIALSLIGGWWQLAREYRFSGSFAGKQWRSQNVRMRAFVRYRTSVNIGADEAGLYLSVSAFFRLAHAPLFVPWSDVTLRERDEGIIFRNELRFSKEPDVPVQVTKKMAAELQEFLAERSEDWSQTVRQ
jgi:hypothetical protein